MKAGLDLRGSGLFLTLSNFLREISHSKNRQFEGMGSLSAEEPHSSLKKCHIRLWIYNS